MNFYEYVSKLIRAAYNAGAGGDQNDLHDILDEAQENFYQMTVKIYRAIYAMPSDVPFDVISQLDDDISEALGLDVKKP